MQAFNRGVSQLVRRSGLSRPAYRLYEIGRRIDRRSLRRNLGYRGRLAPDGLPIPPLGLIVAVAGTPDVEWFLASGALTVGTIRDILARNGLALEGFSSILDFGCGCGRTIRHLRALDGPALSGSDYNPALIRWCRANLPFARFEVNGAAPPLPYPAASFDFVYAFSVFTHFSAELQRPWIDEVARVLVPGGYLLLTTHGEDYLDRLTPDEIARYRDGRLVVRHGEVSGANLCAAFHPRRYLEGELCSGLEVVDFVSGGALEGLHQDYTLVRKPA